MAITPCFACGAECGFFSSGWWAHGSIGAGSIAASTSVKRTGDRSWRLNCSNNVVGWPVGIPSGNRIVIARFYRQFISHPTGDMAVGGVISGGYMYGLVYNSADGKYYAGRQEVASTGAINVGSTGLTISTGSVWRKVDIRVDSTSNPWLIDIRIDGASAGQYSIANAAADLGSFKGGNEWFTGAYEYYDDDMLVATTTVAGDYPINDGFVKGFIPNADGTHNTLANFGDLAGANLTDGTVYQHLDKRPLTVGDTAVQQEANSSSSYIEITFEESVDGAPRTVEVVIGVHADGTAGNDPTYVLVSGVDSAQIFSGSIGSTSVIWKRLHMPTLGGTAWTETLFDNLALRFGLALDANPDPYLDAVMLEAEFEDAGTIVTLDVATNAAISTTNTVDVTTNAAVSTLNQQNVTTDAVIGLITQTDVATDAAIVLQGEQDVTTDGAVSAVVEANVSTDAAIAITVLIDVSTDAAISLLAQQDVSTDASILIENIISLDVATDAAISATVEIDVSTDASIQVTMLVDMDVSTDAVVGLIAQQDVSTDAAISVENVITLDVVTDAAISVVTQTDVSTDAAVSVQVQVDVNTDATVGLAVTQDVLTDAAISTQVQIDVTTDAAITVLAAGQVDVFTEAAVSVVVSLDVTTSAVIAVISTQDVATDAAISIAYELDITTDAAIGLTAQVDVATNAAISASVLVDVSSDATISLMGELAVSTAAAIAVAVSADVLTNASIEVEGMRVALIISGLEARDEPMIELLANTSNVIPLEARDDQITLKASDYSG